MNALHYASSNGNDIILKALLNANADVNILDEVLITITTVVLVSSLFFIFIFFYRNWISHEKDGRSALQLGASKGHCFAVRELLAAGADLDNLSKVNASF